MKVQAAWHLAPTDLPANNSQKRASKETWCIAQQIDKDLHSLPDILSTQIHPADLSMEP